jgi:hypothetical protein
MPRRSTAPCRIAERGKLQSLLKQRFELDDARANELIGEGAAADDKAVDLYHFTHSAQRFARRQRPPAHGRDDVDDRLRRRRGFPNTRTT